MRAVAFACLSLLVLAGCADAPSSNAPIPLPCGADCVDFLPQTVSLQCTSKCWEPSVAVDNAGRIFVTAGTSTPIAVSSDGGATFATIAPPPLPRSVPQGVGRADALVHTDPKGHLWFSALVFSDVPIESWNTALFGVQVARSEDAGQTWASNVLLALTHTPTQPVSGADRQWLGFASDGTVYLTYSQITGIFPPASTPVYPAVSAGIMSARSTDGGASWSAWTRAAPWEQRNQMGMHGPPVVDSKGRVFFPVFAWGANDVRELRMVRSLDRGVSWSSVIVVAGAEGYGSWFPVATIDTDDNLVLSWRTTDGRVRTSFSADGASTWSKPLIWTPDGARAEISPWLVASKDGALVLAWFNRPADSAVELHITRGSILGPSDDRVVASNMTGLFGRAANSDMAYVTPGPDGSSTLVWSDAATGALWIASGHTGRVAPT